MWFRPVLAAGLVVGAAAAIRVAPWTLTSAPDLSPWWVGAGVLGSVAGAFGVAKVLGLHRLRQRPGLDIEALVNVLADMADQAKSQGVLAVAGSPQARHSSLLRAGLHLLLRDPDQELVRSVLGAQAEAEARRAGSRRGIQILGARLLAALGVLGGIAAAIIMTLNVETAAVLSWPLAVVIGLGAVLLALGLTVTGPAVSSLRAAAATQAFEAKVYEEAVLAIRDQSNAAQTRARLERLMPSAAAQTTSGAERRRAA